MIKLHDTKLFRLLLYPACGIGPTSHDNTDILTTLTPRQLVDMCLGGESVVQDYLFSTPVLTQWAKLRYLNITEETIDLVYQGALATMAVLGHRREIFPEPLPEHLLPDDSFPVIAQGLALEHGSPGYPNVEVVDEVNPLEDYLEIVFQSGYVEEVPWSRVMDFCLFGNIAYNDLRHGGYVAMSYENHLFETCIIRRSELRTPHF